MSLRFLSLTMTMNKLVSYWNEELVSDAAEACDHGPNCCCIVWCQAWEDKLQAHCILAGWEDIDKNLWEKQVSVMWDAVIWCDGGSWADNLLQEFLSKLSLESKLE